MPTTREFKVGQIYYIIQYQDEKLTRPIVSSCTYKGLTDKGPDEGMHVFTLLGFADDELFLRGRDLDIVLDLQGLLKELSTPGRARRGIDHAS